MRAVSTRVVLIVAVLTVIVLAVLGTGSDPRTVVSIFSTRFLGIFIEAVPFLLLGTLVSGLIEAFVTPDLVTRLVPHNRLLAAGLGTLLGFAFPVCECGVVPVTRRLFHKGLPMSVGIAFLLASPVMNPIVIASTLAAFGFGPIFIGRFVITALVATSVGLIFAFNARPREVLLPQSLSIAPGGAVLGQGGGGLPLYTSTPANQRKPLLLGIREALQIGADEFFEMGRYLIIGSLLAATMQTFVTQDALLALGRGPVQSVVFLQILAFVLSVCSTVDAFLALAFVNSFTSGSVLAFLTFGPMVDIKSTLMFLGVFRRKTVLYLVLLPLLMTMLIGIWMNLNLPV